MKKIDARTMSVMLAGTFMVSALGIARPASADTQAEMSQTSASEDKTPSVPAALQGLMRLIGSWDADATLVMEGKHHRVPYHVDFKAVADGSGLYGDESFADPDLGRLNGGNLIGFDPYDSQIHWYSVDNAGTTHEHIGYWKTPDQFHMEHQGLREGKAFVEKIDLTFKGKDELVFKLVATLGGQEVERGEANFHRNTALARQ